MRPKAILLDLDDTIIAYDHGIDVDRCWSSVCGKHMGLEAEAMNAFIENVKRKAKWYWSDSERHRIGRRDLDAAREEIIGSVLDEAGYADRSVARIIAVEYGEERDRAIMPYPGAVETLLHFRELGIKLALITNGSSRAQRRKIERFALAAHFDCIVIEEEFGAGKPEIGVYEHAMRQLGVEADDTWMIGDNYEWEIAAPQRLSIKGIWINPKGLDNPGSAVPYRTLSRLSDIRRVLAEHA